MANKNIYIWWGSGSIPCWKAMLVLAEKGLWKDCPNKLIEFSKKEHKSEEVLKLNPRGQMPTFKDGGVVINESTAICMYLEEKYSSDSNRLFPKDPAERAQVYQRMIEIDNVRAKIMEPILIYKFRTKKEEWDQALLKERIVAAEEELKRWDGYLTGRDYLVGGKFTMADVFLYPCVAMFKRQSCNFAKYPALEKYYKRLGERASIKATAPPHWAGTPNQTMLEDVGA